MKKVIAVGGLFWIVVIAGVLFISEWKPKATAPTPRPLPHPAAEPQPQNVTCIPATWTLETVDKKGNPVRQHVATWGPDKEHPVAFCFLPNGQIRWLIAGQQQQVTQAK